MGITVRNEPELNRYVILKDDEQVGFTEYHIHDDEIDFYHTEVDPERREGGLASILVQSALDDVRDNSDRRLVASCPYVRHWLREHPEYRDLLAR
ncbi:MAG TPA: GNAT family N-acetyltransferase [Diaminobutyricibacter sp.]|jgi:hypothetical protein|uniref:GNAT family N-acetyltransferase n=1 Tax=Leifsonia sp. McL0618 TaxID=3415677 RepID=UPI0033846F40